MKNLALLFLGTLVVSLVPHQLQAQQIKISSSFGLPAKENAAIYKVFRPDLQNFVKFGKYPATILRVLPNEMNIMAQTKKTSATHNTQVYLLDTVVVFSTNTDRHSYSYDSSGNLTSLLSEQLQNGQWQSTDSAAWTYDANGNCLTELNEVWLNGHWTSSYLTTNTYNASGWLLTQFDEEWQNGQLVSSDSSIYIPDPNGRQRTWLIKELQNGEWVNLYSGTSTYDAKLNLLTEMDKEWQDGQWTNSRLDENTYDADENLLTEFSEEWQNGQLVHSDSSMYTYDANGNLLTYLYKVWNGQWLNSDSITYTYDANGHWLTELHEVWNSQWIDSVRYSATYDANGHQLTWLNELWNNTQWINNERDTMSYDANSNLVLYQHEAWTGSSWILSNSGYDDLTSVIFISPFGFFYTGHEIRYVYSLTEITAVASDKNNTPGGFSLSQNYPNPFNPSTIINYQLSTNSFVVLKVFDVLGREVETLVNERQSAGNHSVRFNATNLPSGVYFYRLQAGTYHDTKKLLLLKLQDGQLQLTTPKKTLHIIYARWSLHPDCRTSWMLRNYSIAAIGTTFLPWTLAAIGLRYEQQ